MQVDKILLDYDEKSVVTIFDQTKDEKQVFTGVEVRQRNRTLKFRIGYSF